MVTLAIYSGLPDPVWKINSCNKRFKEVKEHLNDARSRRMTHRHEHMPSILGYKGLLVHSPETEEPELVVGQETAVLQKLLLETMPEGLISETLHKKVLQAINSGAVSASVPDVTQQSSPKILLDERKDGTTL